MKSISISGTKRADLGKKATKEVRKQGLVPCVIYGEKKDANGAPEAVHFVVDEKQRSCDLTDKGTAWLAEQVQNDQLFVLPDITGQLSALEAENLPDEERVAKKDELLAEYAVKSDRVHTLQQLLKAYSMFTLNDDYVIQDGQVKIVDESTGRIMEGRRWSDGLHQAVEAKEHVKVEAATQTFATITL